ncbi:MAG: Gfo/Idh/MocA family oxidoreductase [Candidatus Bathyarchaeia archaeon]|jgi:predicted dehydrogenase
MKISVIGLGKMGLLHAGIVNSLPDARVTSVCEADFFLSTAAKALLPKEISVYRDVDKMILEEDPDTLFVTTPIDAHVPIINESFRVKSNLNMFVEKPLASSYNEAKAACEAASHSSGVNMVGFQRRFSPIFQKASSLLTENAVGEPIFFRSYFLSSDVLREGSGWRSKKRSGGVLLDSAPHLLDTLIWFFGEPASVLAVKKKIYSSSVDDYVHALFSYASGLQGHMDICWSLSSYRLPELLLQIYGKDGIMTVTDDFVKVSSGQQNSRGGSRTYNRQSFQVSTPFLLTDPEYALEDVAFLEAVRTQVSPDSNFVQAAKVNALIDRILANAT